MASFPSTSFHIRNEQVRLSLLANQDDIPYADGYPSPCGTIKEEPMAESKPKYLTSGEWCHSIHFPSSIPPLENPLLYLISSLWGFGVSSVFVCLFLLGLPIFLTIYLIFGVLLRFVVKVILSWSIPTLLPISRVFGSTNGSDNHIVQVVLSGDCNIHKIQRSFMNVINSGKYYKLKKRLTKEMGYLCLDNCRVRFNIQNHVKYFENRMNLTSAPSIGQEDIIKYLEEQSQVPFEGRIPQWEVLVVPDYTQPDKKGCGNSYALIFRVHNGIMDWAMLRELITVYLGKSSGRVSSPFKANPKQSLWQNIKIFFAFFFCGPAALLRKVFKGDSGDKLWPLKRLAIGDLSFGITKPIPSVNWEEIQEQTRTGNHCAIASCIRTSIRNVFLSQNVNFPQELAMTRVFDGHTPGVDSISASYNKNRRILDRLHTCFHAIAKRNVNLAATRVFKKMFISMASTLPLKMANWLHGIIMKGEVVVHFWPGVDEHVRLFGGDHVTHMCGWSGGHGANLDFTITVSSYSGSVSASVVSRVGELSSGVTGAVTVANELEEEYKHLATAIGIREFQFFMS